MTFISLVLLTAVCLATLSTAVAAPREHERVVYPPDGGLSRPIIGKKVATTTTAQTVVQSADEIEDEIDSYLQNPHNEKHIFRKKPKPVETLEPTTQQLQEESQKVDGPEEQKSDIPSISGNPESTSEQKPDSSYKPQEPNYDAGLPNNEKTFSNENVVRPIAGNGQSTTAHSPPNVQEPDATPQNNLGLKPTNNLPEHSYSSNLGSITPETNAKPGDTVQGVHSNNAAPEKLFTPDRPSKPESSGNVPNSAFEQKEQYNPHEQSSPSKEQNAPTEFNPEISHTGNNDQNLNKPQILQNPSPEQQSQNDYNINKVEEAHNDYNAHQNNNKPKPEETSPQNLPQNPSEQENKHEVPEPAKETEMQVRYDGSQLWKIPIDEKNKIRLVNYLSVHHVITTWGGNRSYVDALIAPENVSNVTEALARSGIPYEVIIPNLQKAIEEENPPLDEEQLELQNRKGHRLTWVQYHRVQDIHGFLDYLAATYPQLCRVQSIGRSYEGRDLRLLKISNGRPNNKAVFIDGGIHAREWIAPATVTYIINHIIENYETGPEIYRSLDWYFVPVVNPDGYEYTHSINRLWRKNRSGYGACPGVDLNRNFGFKWGGKGTSSSPCSDVYRGPSAFSELESQAIRDFILGAGANFKLYATYHSYGQFILYPWGYDEISPPDDYDLKRAGNNAAEAIWRSDGTQYVVGTSSKVLYASAGGSDDWAKAVPGIKYSYTIELPDTGKHGFVLPARYILRVGKESVKGLEKLAEAAASA